MSDSTPAHVIMYYHPILNTIMFPAVTSSEERIRQLAYDSPMAIYFFAEVSTNGS